MTPAILHGKNPDNPDVFFRNPIIGNRIQRNRRNPEVASLSRIPKQQKINLGHRILRNRSKPWVSSLPRIPKQQKINRAQEHGYVELDKKERTNKTVGAQEGSFAHQKQYKEQTIGSRPQTSSGLTTGCG